MKAVHRSKRNEAADIQMLPKGLLLDMDDTILAYAPVGRVAWAQVIDEFQTHFAPATPARILEAITVSARHYWSDAERHRLGRLNFAQARTNIVQSALGTVGIDNMSLARSIAARFHELRTQMIHPLPGAIDTLTFFKQAGVPMVLVTNGDAAGQRQKIQRFHLESYFKGILIEEECGFGKPDQRIYRRALRVLGLEPQAVWMVGDNLEWEVIAPARLGIPGIWVDYRGQGLPDHCPTEPLMVVSCLADLIQ